MIEVQTVFRFECDYGEGAVQKIIERLGETNLEQTCGYGLDDHCERARALIAKHLGNADADIHLMVGGTQVNLTVIAAALRPWQGVIAAHTGHINVHESGAIEATGHKVLPLQGKNGKITAGQIDACCTAHWADTTHEHIVQPAMVYISQPTEYGTLYTKEELTEMRFVCDKHHLMLYIDGARMGYGLTAEGNDVSLEDLAALSDAFYIGGTKVGALFGEALVITNPLLKTDFRYIMKQRGGMLAKGRLLGIQFECLFEDDTYFEISKHANSQAARLRRAFQSKGISFLIESPTNQLFPVLTEAQMAALEKDFAFSYWEKVDENHHCVRFCTSWATKAEAVDRLIHAISSL